MFGPIRSVRRYGRDSAVVVFEDLGSACRAMSAFENRVPDRGLLCAWHPRFMSRAVKVPQRDSKETEKAEPTAAGAGNGSPGPAQPERQPATV
ncbi:testis expressed protein 56-like [Sorex araneus]|uniref:testis expressed protein 56-like n=1 Tax=Sorex araneus TaxID=42254 RepID=UPI00243384D5|nr:testis expressed protein 56-like [Sorex araneus]XP_054984750.1 testis expressed protein 56-like [Sorex araneus]